MAVKIPSTDRIIEMGSELARSGKNNPFYHRCLKALEPKARQQVLDAIAAQGGKPHTNGAAPREQPVDDKVEQERRERRARVFWGPEAWERLITIAYRLRENDPTESLTGVLKQAMEQMPAHEQKNVSAAIISQAADQMRAHAIGIRSELHKLANLREKLATMEKAPSREQIIDSLTEDELRQLAWRVVPVTPLAEIVHQSNVLPETFLEEFPLPTVLGFATRKLCEGFSPKFAAVMLAMAGAQEAASPKADALRRAMEQQTPGKARQFRVIIIGPKGDQRISLAKQLEGRCALTFGDTTNGQYQVPASSDIVVIWTKFVNQQHEAHIKAQLTRLPKSRLMIVPGGMETIADRVKDVLDSLSKE